MRVCNLALAAALLLGALLSGCGGSTGPAPGNGDIQVRERFPGPGMPAATPDDFVITDDGKIASAIYRKFWADSVNEQSGGRWTVTNINGPVKTWVLSNTYNSSPKAWLMGGNYWNSDTDSLQSVDFTIPANTGGVRLTFWARWKTAAGDYCDVNYFVDGVGQLVTSFEGGQNPDYPGWTKYFFVLPDNDTAADQDCSLEFWFDSNGSINDWGIGVDNVAVYQRGLEPPINVDASEGGFSITVSWDYADTGTLDPDFVDIYRSTTSGGPYDYQDSVAFNGTLWSDPTALADTNYYYVLKATKDGWFNSADSVEDLGNYTGF
jgi:hypothetical protein